MASDNRRILHLMIAAGLSITVTLVSVYGLCKLSDKSRLAAGYKVPSPLFGPG